MNEIELEKSRALDEHYARFSCAHDTQQLRRRIVTGGSEQYVFQCLSCGWAASQPIKKEKAFQLNGGEDFTPYDETLHGQWNTLKDQEKSRIDQEYNAKRAKKESEFQKSYTRYLKSHEWKRKREKVIARANGRCEGCLENPAEVVHHLSYEHVGAEFLFELVAVCQACHDRLHEPREAHGK